MRFFPLGRFLKDQQCRRWCREITESPAHPGPQSVCETLEWPQHFHDALEAASLSVHECQHMYQLYMLNMESGAYLNTSYSGMGTVEQGAHALTDHARSRSASTLRGIVALQASDRDPTCQRVLSSFDARQCPGPQHVFGPNEDLLDGDLASRVQKIRRDAKCSVGSDSDLSAELCLGAVESLEAILQTQLQLPLDCERVAHCWIHDGPCPVYDDIMSTAGSTTGTGSAGAVDTDTDSDSSDEDDALRVNVSVTTCKAWSRRSVGGKNRGRLHLDSMLSFVVWCFVRLRHKEHLIIHECTEDFPVWLLLKYLASLYVVVFSVILTPVVFGFPMRRPRRYTLLRRKDVKFLVESPFVFLTMFGRECNLPGSAYFVAPDGAASDLQGRLANDCKRFGCARSQFRQVGLAVRKRSGAAHTRSF